MGFFCESTKKTGKTEKCENPPQTIQQPQTPYFRTTLRSHRQYIMHMHILYVHIIHIASVRTKRCVCAQLRVHSLSTHHIHAFACNPHCVKSTFALVGNYLLILSGLPNVTAFNIYMSEFSNSMCIPRFGSTFVVHNG